VSATLAAMMIAVGVMLALLLGIGLVLLVSARKWRPDEDSVVEQINQILPQTQCGQCDYPGCRPYAEAIASGEADINQCPPGGEAGVKALADLLAARPSRSMRRTAKPSRLWWRSSTKTAASAASSAYRPVR